MSEVMHRSIVCVSGLWLTWAAWSSLGDPSGAALCLRPMPLGIPAQLLALRDPEEAPQAVRDPFDTPPPMIPMEQAPLVVTGPPPEAPFLVLEAVLLTPNGGSARLAGRHVGLGDPIPGIDEGDPPVLVALESTLAIVAWRDRTYVLELGARPRPLDTEDRP